MRWVALYLYHCANNVYAFKNLAFSKTRWAVRLVHDACSRLFAGRVLHVLTVCARCWQLPTGSLRTLAPNNNNNAVPCCYHVLTHALPHFCLLSCSTATSTKPRILLTGMALG